jgi:hypothetical protein
MLSRNIPECVVRLRLDAGIDLDDAMALRRVAMTLHRWHELECGDSNDHNSFCLVRGIRTRLAPGAHSFEHSDTGKPYIECHHHLHGRGKDYVTYTLIADREAGALRRLARIMAKYPHLTAYVQTDPRGASLYILKTTDIPEGANVDSCYNRGVAVYK